MSPLWYMSFVDNDRPAGTRHLGVCLVPASDLDGAIAQASALGCNPGGEVLGFEVPHDRAALVNDGWLGRLLVGEDYAAFEAEVNDRIAKAGMPPVPSVEPEKSFACQTCNPKVTP